MAITISLVAVFLPIAMMEGIVGKFLKSFGITMSATILVSMLVSFTLTPMLAARWFKKATEGDEGEEEAEGASKLASKKQLPSPVGRGAGGEGGASAPPTHLE